MGTTFNSERLPLRKVLLLAEAANPEWTSVPLIGWSLSQALTRQVEAHIVTQIRNRQAFLRAGLKEGRDFTAIDNESAVIPLMRLSGALRSNEGLGWTTLAAFSSLAYYTFERKVWSCFKERLASGEFDLVHRITPLSPTSQSPIAGPLGKMGVPFIVGPLNGGLPWPRNFRSRQKAERDWLFDLRWLHKLMPYYRSTRKFASAILCGSRHTLSEMPAWAAKKCVYLPENGVDLTKFPLKPASDGKALQAAFIGRLVPYKGADIFIRSASDFLRANQLHLHIIGDGPQMPDLRALAQRLNVDRNITFHGWVEHRDIQKVLNQCDFTALPSIREFGGGVVIESLAMGLPMIVADYGGPGELVEFSRGIRVSFTDETSLLEGLKSAIERLIKNPAQLPALGLTGRIFIETNLTWDKKAQQVLKVYEAVMKGEPDLSKLPIFPTPDMATPG
jgi:glycosyltransferase involved in cell wall biosynthesis